MGRDTQAPLALVVDDEVDVRWLVCNSLAEEGFRCAEAGDAETALALYAERRPDCVLLDYRLPDRNGMEVLAEIRDRDEETPIVILTAFGNVRLAVSAIRKGATEFLSKPFTHEELTETVRKILANHPSANGDDLHEPDHPLNETMGSGAHVLRIISQVDRVAASNLSVLITGESGTGKELVAHAIHQMSPRSGQRMVALDCGAIPEGLVESELFGHQEGAFTGAGKSRPGAFEAVTGGTLFLDEIGNLPIAAQNALLRTLEVGEVHRLGSLETVKVDVRLVAATNRDFDELIREGSFRADLYHRLAEFEIRIPPLRERRDDIPFLVNRFIRLANHDCGRKIEAISGAGLASIQAYDWPGNVRELRNVIRRAVVMADTVIEPRHLPNLASPDATDPTRMDFEDGLEGNLSLKEVARRTTREVERNLVEKVLSRTGGNKARAARILKVDYKTLHKKVKEYGLNA